MGASLEQEATRPKGLGSERTDARRNREAVLASAVPLLARRPAASMREVADASGLGRTTVYRHFPTRDALLAALFARVGEEAGAIAAEAARRPGPALDALRWLGPPCVALGERFRFLQAHRGAGEMAPSRVGHAPDDPLPRFLADAQRRGELRSDLPVPWLMASLRGLAVVAVDEVGAGRLGVEEAGALLGEAFAALAAPVPPPG